MQETEFRDMNQRRHHAMSLCAISLLTVFAFLPTYLLERIPYGVG